MKYWILSGVLTIALVSAPSWGKRSGRGGVWRVKSKSTKVVGAKKRPKKIVGFKKGKIKRKVKGMKRRAKVKKRVKLPYRMRVMLRSLIRSQGKIPRMVKQRKAN